MIVSVHTIAGAMLSDMPMHAVIIFFISFFSHFLLDMIPHGDKHIFRNCTEELKLNTIKKYILIDLIISFGLIIFFFFNVPRIQYWALSAGIFGNLLPDLLVALYEMFNIKCLKKFHQIHTFFHDLIKYQPKFTIIIQIVAFIILFKSFI